MRVIVAQSSFGCKAKMTNFSHIIFSTFQWFSNTFSCTLQHIKNLAHCLFVSARYCRFWLSAWSKIKNFDPGHNSKIIYFWYFNNLAFMVWVKNFYFWPCCDILPKQKNNVPNFLYVAKYMKIYQKIIKRLEKCRGKI